MGNKQKNYFSTREAAERLNVAVSTIQLWTDNGKLSAWTTVGGHRRIDKSSVDQMLQQNKATSNKKVHEKRLSVLVVEDNEKEQKLYEQYFEIWKFNADVCIVQDGYAGLINIGKTSPDIIITDLMMPDMNGFEMLQAIKNNLALKNSFIIVVSALTEDEIKMHGGLPSDVHVFSKPISFDKLEVFIRNKLKLYVA